MTYHKFKNSVLHLPIIYSKDLAVWDKNMQSVRNQLRRWKDKGLIVHLKKGVYLLNEKDRKITPSRAFIANQLYGPSYVSTEYALGFYGLIPERVSPITSVTTRKTARFTNELGAFNYQHIKLAAFRGFKMVKDECGFAFFIAEPEKAIVDFLYLNLEKFSINDAEIFEQSYRFQNLEDLRQKEVMQMAKFFNSNKLEKVAALFCKFIKKG